MNVDNNDNNQTQIKLSAALINVGVALVFVLSLFITKELLRGDLQLGPLKYAVALLPLIPISWFWFEQMRQIKILDELQSAIEIKALAISLGAIVWLTTLWGLFEAFAGVPHFPLVFIAPITAAIYGITRFFLSRTYK